MELLAQLAVVDVDNKFESIIEDYYKQLNDEKISTIKCCISCSLIVIDQKPQLASEIISKIVYSLNKSTHSDRHQNFLISGLLRLLSSIELNISEQKFVVDFLNTVYDNTKSAKIKREIKNMVFV